MDWIRFLSGLLEDGRLAMPPLQRLSRRDVAELKEALRPYEQAARLGAPAGVPAWDAEAGSWAAAMFYRACQFVVYRDLDAKAIAHQLDDEGPAPTPAAHWSVDLCFRYLPDLLRFARSAAEDDPLLARLTRWSQQWPLSSVGADGLDAEQLRMDGLRQSPALMQIYVDRVVAAGDKSRLSDADVRAALQEMIGAHPELAPAPLLEAAECPRDDN